MSKNKINNLIDKNKNVKFYLYHIKGKKWGCTKELKKRLSNQGYTIDDTEEVKEVIGIELADKLEKELNIRYGYKWNDTQSYIKVLLNRSKGGSIGGKISGPIVGKSLGKHNVQTGWLDKIRTIEGSRKGGLKNKKSGHIQNIGKLNGKLNGIKYASKKIKAYDLITGELYKVYTSMSEASRDLKCSVASISYATQGKLKQVKGYTFRYA